MARRVQVKPKTKTATVVVPKKVRKKAGTPVITNPDIKPELPAMKKEPSAKKKFVRVSSKEKAAYTRGTVAGMKSGATLGVLGGASLAYLASRLKKKSKKKKDDQREDVLQQSVKNKLIERWGNLSVMVETLSVVKSWAKKAGISTEEAEKRWDEAKKAAVKQGRSPEEGDSFYKYVMGIYKTMMYKNNGQNDGGRGTKALQKADNA